MTLAAKYEILEAVTNGAVETFVARKVATGEHVMVCIFECKEQPPNKPTVQWILESFRAVAPDLPESVAETGRYDATSYGYLVTELPEQSTLQAWVQSYEAQQHAGTKRIVPLQSAQTVGADEGVREASDAVIAGGARTPTTGSERPEGITKAFETLRSELKASSANSQPSARQVDQADPGTISPEFRRMGLEATGAAQPNTPGDFTRQFSPGSGGQRIITSVHSEMQSPEGPREPSELAEEISAKGTDDDKHPVDATDLPSAIFRKLAFAPIDSAESSVPDSSAWSSTASEPKPASARAPDEPSSINTGDFTKFFRGPFGGQRHAETPDLSPAVPKKREETGEFTRIFGPPKRESSADLASSQAARRNPSGALESNSFTNLFESPEVPKKTPIGHESTAPSGDRFGGKDSGFSLVTEQTKPTLESRPSSIPKDVSSSQAMSGATGEPNRPFASHSEPEGATRVFSVPAREPEPSLSNLRAGPSEYTRIISSGPRKPSTCEELPDVPRPQASPSARAALPAGLPVTPAAPPLPQFPQAGGLPPAPTPLTVPTPAVSSAPQLGAAKPAGVPWALILTLNGLFVLAVLLVVYFVLKR